MKRSRYLDVLRGIALLGILPVNIVLFGLPFGAYEDPDYVTGGTLRERIAFHATSFFFEFKFVTLFSLLFGVGMVVMRERANATGRSYRRVMLRRLLFLWLFGILHAALVWDGDILSYYAPLGLLVFWTSRWDSARLKKIGVALIALPAAVMLVLAGLAPFVPAIERGWQTIDNPPDPGPLERPATESWGAFWAGMENWGSEFETQVRRDGTFLQITIVRFFSWFLGFLFWGIYMVWRIGGLFLLGMAWTKEGWLLSPGDHRAKFRRLALLGLACGLLLEGGSSLLGRLAPDTASWGLAGTFGHYAGSLGLAAAYAGAVGLLLARWPKSRAFVPFEAVGRTAFSNYLLQSILCTTLFYSYGFALFGSLGRAELWGVAGCVWAIQLAVSPLWLSRFRIGPFEWIWRSLTYWKPQPWRSS